MIGCVSGTVPCVDPLVPGLQQNLCLLHSLPCPHPQVLIIAIFLKVMIGVSFKVFFMVQGFPKKTPVSQNFKNIPDLLSDDKECKIM